ncbi:unnamed protein product [Triticum turgidum subsp. durum]|uniref:Fe2OG dioxygenase domain-containing protein n=1 Tax=Triticum turgidum subsp. durum TaxID=4567 RepID=A0A9R1QTG4_TRITD|nr:unnamed protein product [Triticum turgidum subsp. durum]
MEETKPRNLGGSLPVPNVQDLAARADDLTLTPTLLRRYVRPQPNTADLRHDAPAGEEQEHVPIIDLGRLLGPNGLAGGRGEEAARLRSACEDWGFFQLVNHGIPEETLEEMKRNVMGFFALPLAEKAALAQQPGEIEGNCLENYSEEVQRVAGELLGAMAEILGVRDHSDMTRLAASQSVRMNYYPPCPEAHVDSVLGLSPHSDAVGLTLLLQVSKVPGLQIRRKGGWVPVTPLPGALVVNVGDVIEVLTNGKYKSVEHRAVVNAREERMSIATFHTGKFGTMYGPLEEVVGDEKPRYRSVSVEEYVKLVFSSKLNGKNIMDAMKIN